MDIYRSGADTPVARKRPTGAPAPPLIGRPTGGFTTAFRMSAHRPASTDPVTAPAPATAGSLRAPRWGKTGHLPITAGCPPQ